MKGGPQRTLAQGPGNRPGQLRHPALGFALHALENLPHAEPCDMPIRTQLAQSIIKLTPVPLEQMPGVRRLLGEVIKQWPVGEDSSKLSLVSGYSFYQERIRPILHQWRNIELNGPDISFDQYAKGFGFDKIWKRVCIIFVNV
jgi:hypothetical protein